MMLFARCYKDKAAAELCAYDYGDRIVWVVQWLRPIYEGGEGATIWGVEQEWRPRSQRAAEEQFQALAEKLKEERWKLKRT
jgi:hypothetical protein